jgi:hypothetical protein
MAEADTASPAARCHGHTSAATIATIATGRPPTTNPNPKPQPAFP